MLGIRPEDITFADGQGDLQGTVYSSELLGDSTLLNVRVGDALISAKVGPDDGRDMDSAITLVFNRAKAHVFDAETGLRRD